ncbi:ABC transporter ATP-binding protein [Phytoactinopolyspora halotolerans]|uniref:ABC transporter ATP-binding protein n=1 Tax=Phytoactinopolyspora halotolerans TaxID=1981512 RepID=A0A6L9SCI8_9ACTN|nr:ABC transporter ATP-binding protein [Phytoactinopolyspora halotolerans]
MLEVERVIKEYRKGVRANDDVSLSVSAGEVYGLLGHNGAGKTTLLNQVVGIAKPTAGTIRVTGRDAVADPAMARRMCSMQPQAQAPLDGVSPAEAIELMARIRGANRRRAKQRTAELVDALDIGEWAKTTGERLSGGVRRLTAFAMAAAEPGRLVMFDEPTNDVDPVRRRLLWAEVRALAENGCAVLLVTHNVIEAERAVDRLAILDRGRVVAQGSPADLRGENADRLRLEVTAVDSAVARDLAAQFGGQDRGENGAGGGREDAVVVGRRMMATVNAAECASALAWAQNERTAGRVDEFSFNPVSLEDIYVRLVGSDGGNNEGDRDAALVA